MSFLRRLMVRNVATEPTPARLAARRFVDIDSPELRELLENVAFTAVGRAEMGELTLDTIRADIEEWVGDFKAQKARSSQTTTEGPC